MILIGIYNFHTWETGRECLPGPAVLSQGWNPGPIPFCQACPIQSCCHSQGDQRWPPSQRQGLPKSLPNKILQAPGLSHRFRSEPSFVELKSIKMQASLEVAPSTPTFICRFLGNEALKCSQEKKANLEEVRKGGAERTRT